MSVHSFPIDVEIIPERVLLEYVNHLVVDTLRRAADEIESGSRNIYFGDTLQVKVPNKYEISVS